MIWLADVGRQKQGQTFVRKSTAVDGKSTENRIDLSDRVCKCSQSESKLSRVSTLLFAQDGIDVVVTGMGFEACRHC